MKDGSRRSVAYDPSRQLQVVRVSPSDVHGVGGNQVVCIQHGLGFGVWSCGKCFSEPDAASPALLHATLKGRERMQLRVSTLGTLGV